jgi:diamine N-acetyltransferase
MDIELVDVTAANWHDVAAVTPHPGQQRFAATTTHYLCLCHYGGRWSPLAVVADGAVVRFVMWAEDTDRSRRIGRLRVPVRRVGDAAGT